MGGTTNAAASEMAMLWILNLSDGQHDLLDIAVRSGIPFDQISRAADALKEPGFLQRSGTSNLNPRAERSNTGMLDSRD